MTSKKSDESLRRSKDIAIESCWRQHDVGFEHSNSAKKALLNASSTHIIISFLAVL